MGGRILLIEIIKATGAFPNVGLLGVVPGLGAAGMDRPRQENRGPFIGAAGGGTIDLLKFTGWFVLVGSQHFFRENPR